MVTVHRYTHASPPFAWGVVHSISSQQGCLLKEVHLGVALLFQPECHVDPCRPSSDHTEPATLLRANLPPSLTTGPALVDPAQSLLKQADVKKLWGCDLLEEGCKRKFIINKKWILEGGKHGIRMRSFYMWLTYQNLCEKGTFSMEKELGQSDIPVLRKIQKITQESPKMQISAFSANFE